ncbi:MAG: efflux RND transporter periplasmic adaptor subunit [Bacteroidetes bacterium]|nr:efflux RND transporter periplasmic adaptor subunit [Bacteroidota bacterium]
MKKNKKLAACIKAPFRGLGVVAIASLLLVSCGNFVEKKGIDDKKKQLAEYKTQVKDLSGKIEMLEKEIAKLDTGYHVAQKTKLITVETLKKQDFKHYIEVQGNVDAEENVIALNQQPGIVTSINVKVGDHVTKGQILGLTQTTAAIEDQVRSTETQVTLAKTAFEKQARLWEQKVGSEIQYLQAKTQKEAAEAGLSGLKKQLEMTKIIAPISGTVDVVNLRIGDMAAPSQLMPGIRIINEQNLKVKAKLADSDFGKIKNNDKIHVEFPDINKEIETTVSYVSKTIDPRSRTFSLEAKLNNSHGEYGANMIAKLKINDAVLKNVLLVPSNVIQKSADGNYVLIAKTEAGTKSAEKRMVKTGAEYNGVTVVTEGLNEGDNIITFGYSEVVDGQRIEY